MTEVGITFWAQNFNSDHSKLGIFFIVNTFIVIFFWFDRGPETWPSRAWFKFLEYKTNMIIFWADRWPKIVETLEDSKQQWKKCNSHTFDFGCLVIFYQTFLHFIFFGTFLEKLNLWLKSKNINSVLVI